MEKYIGYYDEWRDYYKKNNDITNSTKP